MDGHNNRADRKEVTHTIADSFTKELIALLKMYGASLYVADEYGKTPEGASINIATDDGLVELAAEVTGDFKLANIRVH